jgi:hypothetical protein
MERGRLLTEERRPREATHRLRTPRRFGGKVKTPKFTCWLQKNPTSYDLTVRTLAWI